MLSRGLIFDFNNPIIRALASKALSIYYSKYNLNNLLSAEKHNCVREIKVTKLFYPVMTFWSLYDFVVNQKQQGIFNHSHLTEYTEIFTVYTL